MTTSRRYRFLSQLSAVAAVVAGFMAVLTLVNAEWIEAIFGVDPDGGSGELEWIIVLGLATFSAVATRVSLLSRRASLTHAVLT